ncbi:MAG: hypothetical protein ABUS79_03045 [Pseudomonadota bacterium]
MWTTDSQVRIEARLRFRMAGRLVAGGLSLMAVGCSLFAPSEDEVRADFDAYVRTANSCQIVSDCTVVSPGCPLGCQVAVAKARQADVERKARELIDDYESGGRACAYGCADLGSLACTAGHCALGVASSGP